MIEELERIDEESSNLQTITNGGTDEQSMMNGIRISAPDEDLWQSGLYSPSPGKNRLSYLTDQKSYDHKTYS